MSAAGPAVAPSSPHRRRDRPPAVVIIGHHPRGGA
ncbi:hypothetical protein Ae406Ps2_5140 [Pseudonocardia sp. Ae406_Ps2]|nr:hypothetical protein Ae331Ps2_0817c [Pseudonocardia sp. Ae331_Ps2]OLM05140.1 hypothetical protein Ae406Ps2_5140 [Pseudonocardia sp. Ae406_Ps2]OLM26711.1 hypothetical protein Ae706Ps2_5144 [Pseudonocardia sp. Ae706_Ps2]